MNQFEAELEAFVNDGSTSSGTDENENLSKRVVALSCGTAAVHLALINCGVKAGDEVLVQSFTFCASSHPITYLGAKPVFVGSERETWWSKRANEESIKYSKKAIEKIEIAYRVAISNVMCKKYGSHWFTNKETFKTKINSETDQEIDYVQICKEIINKEIKKKDDEYAETFIANYYKKYYNV